MRVCLFFMLHVFTLCFGSQKCMWVTETAVGQSSPSNPCDGQRIPPSCLCVQRGQVVSRAWMWAWITQMGSTGKIRKASELAQSHEESWRWRRNRASIYQGICYAWIVLPYCDRKSTRVWDSVRQRRHSESWDLNSVYVCVCVYA